jgi:hypothetical protein
MFNWLVKNHECNTIDPDDTLNSLMESEDHLRKSEEYKLMEASYVMYVHFVDGSSVLKIKRKFRGYGDVYVHIGSFCNIYSGNYYIKPSVTAADQRQKIKDNLPTHGITDGDTVYLAHTISKVEFSEITTKGED